MNKLRKAVDNLIEHAMKSSKMMARILNPAPGGVGGRLAPSKTPKNDGHFSIRWDLGESLKDQPHIRRIYLQANLEADDPTIRKLAQEDHHRKLSYTDVDTTKEPSEEGMLDLKEQFKKNMKL
ncbi:hypothetical protein DM02DRAFT_440040 [Periconia macrospinosa]|uniref:Uncharacterized protein n=1 Tax=Periconia macrospinosa TaxID=97972 RepID=A0A2V1DMY4_9PLEO|nr:hypothetical protein DM02DRAFT_440040 [Periconia macrospinosa]